MTETKIHVSTDLLPAEVAALLFDQVVGPQAALDALVLAWPASMADQATVDWWMGFLSGMWDARFGFDTYVTADEVADPEWGPFFGGYRAAMEVAR